jgi:hypothetical protein
MRAHAPKQATPAAYAPRPFRHLEIRSRPLDTVLSAGTGPRPDVDVHAISRSRSTMAETTVRRVRHTSRQADAERKNAAAALQRALDRRDNGGSTGH